MFLNSVLLFCFPEDSMWYNDGMYFSTYDNDNDAWESNWNFTEGGGIAVVTGQILTGNMGTQIMAKGLSGKPGEVMVTQWKKLKWRFVNPRDDDSYKQSHQPIQD